MQSGGCDAQGGNNPEGVEYQSFILRTHPLGHTFNPFGVWGSHLLGFLMVLKLATLILVKTGCG